MNGCCGRWHKALLFVSFFENEINRNLFGKRGPELYIVFTASLATIDDPEQSVCLFDDLAHFSDAQEFDGVYGLVTHPSGVDHMEGHTAQLNVSLDEITGGARNGGHYGPVFAQKLVEKGRFSGVGFANNGACDPLAYDLAIILGLDEFLECAAECF